MIGPQYWAAPPSALLGVNARWVCNKPSHTDLAGYQDGAATMHGEQVQCSDSHTSADTATLGRQCAVEEDAAEHSPVLLTSKEGRCLSASA